VNLIGQLLIFVASPASALGHRVFGEKITGFNH